MENLPITIPRETQIKFEQTESADPLEIDPDAPEYEKPKELIAAPSTELNTETIIKDALPDNPILEENYRKYKDIIENDIDNMAARNDYKGIKEYLTQISIAPYVESTTENIPIIGDSYEALFKKIYDSTTGADKSRRALAEIRKQYPAICHKIDPQFSKTTYKGILSALHKGSPKAKINTDKRLENIFYQYDEKFGLGLKGKK